MLRLETRAATTGALRRPRSGSSRRTRPRIASPGLRPRRPDR
jgi:hypothetical protein